MAARKRDYKAEYARRKALAKKKGYKSVREYKSTRKRLTEGGLLKPRASAPKRSQARKQLSVVQRLATSEIATMRADCAAWSESHSHVTRSQYSPAMSDAEVRDFHDAYVEYNPKGLSRRKAARDKRRRIGRYVKKWHTISEDEWAQKYELQQV